MRVKLKNLYLRVRNLFVSEVPAITAVIIAAVTAAAGLSPIGYAAAILTALVRFFVSPAFEKKALEAVPIDPKIIAAVQAVLDSAKTAQADVAIAPAPVVPAADVVPDAASNEVFTATP